MLLSVFPFLSVFIQVIFFGSAFGAFASVAFFFGVCRLRGSLCARNALCFVSERQGSRPYRLHSHGS